MEDLRVYKTNQSIKWAFIDLVEEKGFDHVSVKDICAKALINRNTFYLHYYDKVDLLNKIVSEVFIEQEKSINSLKKESTINDRESIKKGFIATLNSFYKEIEFYRVILLDSNMSGHIDKYASHLRNQLSRIYSLESMNHYIETDYIFYGIVGVVKNWIIKDYASIDEIADILTNMTISCFKSFMQ